MEQIKSISMDLISKLNQMDGQTFTLTEKYDVRRMALLLGSTDIIDEEYKGSLIKYKSHAKRGSVKVNYSINKIGRLSIKVVDLKDKETCITQSCMKQIAKGALCSDNYTDVDVVNCHPEMLYQLFKQKGYKCKNLKAYVKNRDEIIETCKDKYNMSRDEVKVLLLKLFYGGKCKSSDPQLFKDIETELVDNRTKLLNLNELLPYRMEAINKKGEADWNIDGTALSYYLQTCECKVLLTMYNYLKDNGYTIGALIHDGLHLDNSKDLTPQHIELMVAKIQNDTGFDLNITTKKFMTIKQLDDTIVVKTDKEGGDIISDLLKHDYVICNERIFMRINDVWTSNDKHIKRGLIKAIGNLDILIETLNKDGEPVLNPHSRLTKGCNALIPFVEPTEDPDFIDKLWSSNIGKLCFKNGYYDFKNKCLKPYDNDVHTTIKINRDYKPASTSIIKDVFDRILNPIFNNNAEQMRCWLNYIARGLAGHVEDKNWGVGIGINLVYQNTPDGTLKVPFEFKRLLLTNEITKDAEGKYKINGNVLKKLSSGGDKIEARVNHKDEINFKIQARVCMFCNDLPPIEPSDAKETAYMFKYPSKFVADDDKRLDCPTMRPKYHIKIDDEGEEEIINDLDADGNPIMINVCNFYKKDDEIKEWFKRPEVMDAFIHIIFDNYSKKVPVPDCMRDDQADFKEDETDESKFYAMFNFQSDDAWVDNGKDFVSINLINTLLRKAGISASPQKYKNWMECKGAVKAKRKQTDGKRVNSWVYVQVNEDKKEEILTDDCMVED